MVKRQFHIAFGSPIDAQTTNREAREGLRPRHFMLEVATRLDAKIWEPDRSAIPRSRTIGDRIASIGPHMAAFAETLVDDVSDEDVIFANSEGASLPIADRLLKSGKRTKLVSFGHNLLRPRMRALMALTGIINRHDIIYVVTPLLQAGLEARLKNSAKIEFIREQIDDDFFAPGPQSPDKKRALIMSVGMEQRDYRTLGAAAEQLDLDVKISGFSRDTKVNAEALPDIMPTNMEQRFFEWGELAQLYRDADIVIAPVRENNYAAGITTILEGMSARRPVIASRTAGLKGIFADEDAIIWVPPGDPAAMNAAITNLLDDKTKRDDMVERATAMFSAGHTLNGQAEAMAARLKAL